MSQLLEHFRATRDPFLLGHSSVDLMSLGYALTGGLVFPYPGGGVVLRRRRLYPDLGDWKFCGFARPDESVIRNAAGFGHEVDAAFQYSAAIVLGNGFVGDYCEPIRVDFDGAGARITPPLPMFPRSVVASTLASGKFRVEWEYDPYGQGAYPTDFQVFAGAAAGSVDFNTPLVDSISGINTTPYLAGQRRFTFTTAAFANGTVKVFAVRARSSAGVAEKNTYTSAAATARTTTASATAVEVTGMRR